MHGRQMKYGDNSYKGIKGTLQINLNNFRCNKELKESYYLINNKTGEKLTEKLQIDMVDMELGASMCYTTNETRLARWCRAFTSKTEKGFKEALDGIMEKDARDKLVDEVNRYSADEEVIQIYTKLSKQEMEWNTYREEAEEAGREKGFKQGIKQGIERGIEQGRYQDKLEVAKNMLNENMDISLIVKITGLSKEKVWQLQQMH